MEYYLILARSITYAQRMERTLARSGIRCQIFRASRDLTDLGCAYALKVVTADIYAVLYMLQRESLNPLKVFSVRGNSYREMMV